MDTKSFMCKDHHFDEESDDSKSLPVCCFNCGTNIEEQLKVLMDHLKPSIGEEVENVLNRAILPLLQKIALTSRASSSVPPQAEPSSSKSLLFLNFKGIIPDELFQVTRIEEEGGWLEVVLVDESGNKVENGPESGVVIKIDALNGDFNVEDKVDWTDEDYNRNIAKPRDNREALLKGKSEVVMTEGAANVSHLAFTDNSSNQTNKTLRLGARVVKGLPPGCVVKAAVSEAFRVKSGRLKNERKHRNPSLTDDIWRLVNISKDGVSCKNANLAGIFSVQDLLRFYHTYPNEAQGVLKFPDAKWNDIIKNAEACNLTKDHLSYHDEASGDVIVLDYAFNIISITFWGQVYPPFKYEDLDDSQKEQANKLRRYAYALQSKVPVSSIQGLEQRPIPPSLPPRSADFVVDEFWEGPNNQYLDARVGEYQVDNLMMENATGYPATFMSNIISPEHEDLDPMIDDWIELTQPEEIEAQQLEEWGNITG